jgi:uncharacterized protein (TIGR02270 family)
MNSASGTHAENLRPLRPVGFRPAEISGLYHREVIEQHASAAAFLWTQRESAAAAPHFKLKHLARLDERTLAHLHGLRVAGEVGWQAALAALEQSGPGSVFVLTYLAFASGEPAKMRDCLRLALAQQSFSDAFEAALVWLEYAEVRTSIGLLQGSAVADHQRLALGTLAGHNVEPGEILGRTLESDHLPLRARALQAVGQFKRRDLTRAVDANLTHVDPACRFWASWALALLGYPQGAQVAMESALGMPAYQVSAIELAMRFGNWNWARQVVRALVKRSDAPRLAIRAAAAFGDPAVVPWLLTQACEPRLARVAGEAVSMITGADLDYLGFKQEPPEAGAEETEPEDEQLPWPDVPRLTEWWNEQAGRYVFGQRYLAGRLIDVNTVMKVLRDGYQRQRSAAALELARLQEASPLWLVNARADRQRRRLAT